MYIGIGTIVVIVIIVLVVLMLRRRLCWAAASARSICLMSKRPLLPGLIKKDRPVACGLPRAYGLLVWQWRSVHAVARTGSAG